MDFEQLKQQKTEEINSFLKKYGDVEIKSKKIRDSGMKFTAVSFNFEL